MNGTLRRFAYVWLIVIGALIIFFGPGGIHVECIACLIWTFRIVAVIAIGLGVMGIFRSDPMPGRS